MSQPFLKLLHIEAHISAKSNPKIYMGFGQRVAFTENFTTCIASFKSIMPLILRTKTTICYIYLCTYMP